MTDDKARESAETIKNAIRAATTAEEVDRVAKYHQKGWKALRKSTNQMANVLAVQMQYLATFKRGSFEWAK